MVTRVVSIAGPPCRATLVAGVGPALVTLVALVSDPSRRGQALPLSQALPGLVSVAGPLRRAILVPWVISVLVAQVTSASDPPQEGPVQPLPRVLPKRVLALSKLILALSILVLTLAPWPQRGSRQLLPWGATAIAPVQLHVITWVVSVLVTRCVSRGGLVLPLSRVLPKPVLALPVLARPARPGLSLALVALVPTLTPRP